MLARRPAASFVLVALLSLTIPLFAAPAGGAADPLLLRLGGLDEMKTRNPLPIIASDVWTADVLDRVYDRPVKVAPDGSVRAYLAKGVDADEDGMFERGEYGTWAERTNASSPLALDIYYDLNGVRWHDGEQMTPWDLLFTYHLTALTWYEEAIRGLYCAPATGYEACGRRLNLVLVAGRAWDGEGLLPGDPALRVALRFTLNEPFVRFAEGTLAPRLFPMHVWSRTGGARHGDFGCAIWIPPTEATARGIPECGTTDSSKWGRGIATTEAVPGSRPYDVIAAGQWIPADADVIGSGPFRFLVWIPGSHASVRRYDGYYVGGPDDPRLAAYLHLPYIVGIDFLKFRTTLLAVFALRNSEIDMLHWGVPPEFVPDLLMDRNIAVEAHAEPGFFYMGYNLRREPWGYAGGDPAQGDRGYWLRQAVSHLIDRTAFVGTLLQNYGVPGYGYVSPANTFWYNDNIVKPAYDLAQARAILDDLATPGGIYDAGFTLDPGSTTDCGAGNPAGCRSLPRIGNGAFEISVPMADFDPIRVSASAMIADAMRRVGLNAKLGPPPPYSPFCAHDFDLWSLGWRIEGTDPGYLYSFFHSRNWPCGQNYAGISNATLDGVLDASRREMDRDARRALIFEAQALLAEIRPYEVLYYRTNIEAHRADRFVNWTVTTWTIWNEWSLFGIHPPGSRTLSLGFEGALGITAGDREGLTFTVRDEAGVPVAAALALAVSSPTGEDPGQLRAGTSSGTSISVTADASGRAEVLYEAPLFYDATRPVTLQVVASHPSYEQAANLSAILTVYGLGLDYLQIRIALPAGDLASPGVPLPVQIAVSDPEGILVPSAFVTLTASPNGTAEPSNGTADALATATVSFPAPGVYTVSALAFKQGYWDAFGLVTVWVLPPSVGGRPPIPAGEPPNWALVGASFAAISAASIGIVVLTVRRRSRGGGPP